MFFAQNQFGSETLRNAYESLPIPTEKRLHATAKFLGVTDHTLKSWLAGKTPPPRAVVYAIWHESPIGHAVTSEHCEDGARLFRALARSQQQTIETMKATIQTLSTELARAKVAKGAPRDLAMNDPVFKYH